MTSWSRLGGQRHADLARRATGRRRQPLVDRLGGVLQEVGEGLVDHRPVQMRQHRRLGQVERVADVGPRGFLQHHRLGDELAEVERPALGRRHPGELGELVDDAPQVVGLADDHVGILLERRALVADHRPELAPQPLGRELDRGQRVLHLVRDAPRHVAPGRHALRDDEVGHVVEGDDVALEVAVVGAAARRRAPAGRARGPCGAAGPRPARRRPCGASSRCEQVGELRHRLGERPAGRRPRVEVEQRRRGGVHHLDAPGAVEADDAGGDARQHRVEQPPPPLGLGVGGDQRVALALHLPGHLVEGPPEQRDLVVALLLADPDVEVALPDPLGRRRRAGRPAAPAARRTRGPSTSRRG